MVTPGALARPTLAAPYCHSEGQWAPLGCSSAVSALASNKFGADVYFLPPFFYTDTLTAVSPLCLYLAHCISVVGLYSAFKVRGPRQRVLRKKAISFAFPTASA